MPHTRSCIPPTHGASYASIRAFRYGAHLDDPVLVPIQTRIAGEQRYPLVDEAFSGVKTQPRIHDIFVKIRRGGRTHRFQVFFKNHKWLPASCSVYRLSPGRRWHGDILIMRAGIAVDGVVNMRSGDIRLANYALRRFLQRVRQGSKLAVSNDLDL